MQKVGEGTCVFTCECKVKLELYRNAVSETHHQYMTVGKYTTLCVDPNAYSISFLGDCEKIIYESCLQQYSCQCEFSHASLMFTSESKLYDIARLQYRSNAMSQLHAISSEITFKLEHYYTGIHIILLVWLLQATGL